MTTGAWLREHPAAPPQLMERVIAAVADHLDEPAEEASLRFLDGAERLLADLLARPSAGRESALDLLTVDALVTFALEAACVHPESLSDRASDAMQRLAALAAA
jgi:hypothetical protein